jgi:putative nucleotidyltransferase with HDIG domain
MNLEQRFLAQLKDDLAHNRLVLPTLPEVAVRVREAVEDPDASAARIAKLVGADPALSARLLRVANSAFYRGRSPANVVQTAVARLGLVMVRNLVTSLVMEQLYQAGSQAALKPHLTRLWRHSTQVAATAQVLARRFTRLSPDQAMLGGLIHDIGTLPILTRAGEIPNLFGDKTTLERVIHAMHTKVGAAVLEAWEFPPEMVAVTAEHEDFARDPGPQVDYVDVVLVANLHSYLGTRHPYAQLDWESVPAFGKLGMTPPQYIKALEEMQEEVAEIQQVLHG